MFLSCGDSLFDMFVDPSEVTDPTVNVNGITGGSPMNVAVGLARLGNQSAYYTKLSEDIFGRKLRSFLETNQVSTSLCPATQLNTTLAFINKRSDGSASYSFYTDNTADTTVSPAELPAQLPSNVRVLHFGSYSTAVNPIAEVLKTLVEREADKRIISYDPNLRLAIEPDVDLWRDTFKHFARNAHVIKASDEDIEALFGANGEDKFVAACFDANAEIVFITRGGSGASVFTPGGNSFTATAEPIQVVDTVGAGDTFQAAVLHWLVAHNHVDQSSKLQGDIDARGALDFALRAAAITCSRFGADLPSLADITG